MTLHTIKLPGGEWKYDDSKRLGEEGGFGEVFDGFGKCGKVAIKRLKINADQAAFRELNIARQLMRNSYLHIVPILDAGMDAESNRYFLIMPICAFSLQDKINDASGRLPFGEVKAAINNIIAGLLEVSDITHRDLKPANVLYHENLWKIADFGIAKFVEDSTSADTLRNSLTPSYAAPEQWRGERPTSATDVYSLGCIIHALFTGAPPFNGSVDDVREHHLSSVPSTLSALPPRFSVFVSHMLRKVPSARPSLERCFRVLSELHENTRNSNPVQEIIGSAAMQVSQREAEQEVRNNAATLMRRERSELFESAIGDLMGLKDQLFDRLRESSESVQIIGSNRLVFGDADLTFGNPEILEGHILAGHSRGSRPYLHTGWDALGWSIVKLRCNKTSYVWSSTLLFADLKSGEGFRWYEIAFWTLSQASGVDEPFGLEGYKEDIDLACGNIMHNVNVAYGPLPSNAEDEESFYIRWIELVAKAALGNLTRPNSMPICGFK